MYLKRTGFTIVELLIVIVVIGILAAITIVAYNGIQNRTHDTAIQSDLRNLASKVREFQAINGRLPSLDMGSTGVFSQIKPSVTKDSYGAHYEPTTGSHNLIYCLSGDQFVFVAASKSGNVYKYSSTTGLDAGVGPLVTYTTTCENNGLNSVGAWLYQASNWHPWVNG